MKLKMKLLFTGVVVLLLLMGVTRVALAATWTDQADYTPGSVVTVSGDNSDNAGYLAGETVHVDVLGPNGYAAPCDAIADDNGAWSCQVTLAGDGSAVGDYSYTAIGLTSGVQQTGGFTDDAPMIGAIYTTDIACNGNDLNIYQAESAVYLDGGPDGNGSGLPDGKYYVKVTEPNGDLLGTSTGTPVTVTDGKFVQCYQLWAILNKASDGTQGYDTSTNGGHEYKVWASQDSAFDKSKTDNFKVKALTDLTVTKTATPSYTRTLGWTIEKSVDQDQINTAGSATFNYTIKVTKDAGTDSDWAASGTITVHNDNIIDVVGVDVTDATPGGDCTVTDGTGLTVPAGGDAAVDYVCTFSSNPGSGTNTATATWPKFGSPNTSATGTADYAFGDPTKLVNDAIDVTDTNGGSWHFTDSGSVPYPMTYTDPAGTCTTHENTATITQTGQTADKTVKVCVGADLTVVKDANPTFTRTYKWNLSKAVDPTLIKQIGGTATFNYTVKVWLTGITDSKWAVAGTITVTNPNDWEAIPADLSDAVNNGGTCTLDSTQVTVPASGSVDVDYSCTFTSGASGVNTATATWDKDTYYTPNGSASGTADFAFTVPTTTMNQTITVTDTFNGVTTTLGTLTAPTPSAVTTFKYSYTVNVPTWNCKTYTNTAKIVETGQSVSQTVEVCGPIKTGALTMGYWQNSNGQGIILAGASTSGVCKSGTWLRTYAPFQDLSATANCQAVATYVYNVIKAANASGTSMNAMLKSQMLATALDVYFSDPALGGNKIKAPAPIGGISIDLTKICKDLSCTAFENSSSVFGGSPKTVLQMLAYAASQSNVGGSIWYGNVKATQELAKDAFDALNNQKVSAP